MASSDNEKTTNKIGKKMLILDCIIFDLQKYGGISSQWSELILNLPSTEYDKALLLTHKSNEKLNYKKSEEFQLFYDKKFRRPYPQYIKLPTEYNVKLFHSSYFRIAKNQGVKNVVTVHDCIPEYYDNFFRRTYYTRQKKQALRNADAIIVVSENTKKDLLKFYPSLISKDIYVIYNGINLSLYNNIGTNSSHGQDDYLLFVGGRGKHKNFEYALALMNTRVAIQKNLKLKVVGGGHFTPRERRLLANLKLSQRVEHINDVGPDELIEHYRSAFAMIYPSFYEGFGIPLVEAMACGCPVICSSTSALIEVAESAALFINPMEVKTAEAALKMLCNQETRDQYTELGLNRSKQFCSKRMARETSALYEECMVK